VLPFMAPASMPTVVVVVLPPSTQGRL